MTGYIYKIWNDINNKLYIGKTLSSIKVRFDEHCHDRKRRQYEKRPLYRAMNKYGEEHFHIELIEECELEQLSSRECYWIEYYDTYHNGYNATRGGDGSQLYDYNLIVDLYDKGLTGAEISKSIGCDTQVVTNALRLANKDTTKNMVKRYSKPIKVYDLNGNYIRQFDSQSDAARWLIEQGIAKTNSVKNVANCVGRVANAKRGTAYKMIWKNVESLN